MLWFHVAGISVLVAGQLVYVESELSYYLSFEPGLCGYSILDIAGLFWSFSLLLGQSGLEVGHYLGDVGSALDLFLEVSEEGLSADSIQLGCFHQPVQVVRIDLNDSPRKIYFLREMQKMAAGNGHRDDKRASFA